jgi:hypothetical protein
MDAVEMKVIEAAKVSAITAERSPPAA